jgi:NRAMP (natural resistance-associated macrophage protein)-like metal ion transporter
MDLQPDERTKLAPVLPGSGGPRPWFSWRFFGPGLLVCLADTDAGCLIVAAQSGSRWGYSLLLLQVLLVPVLFWAQDLTIRLGMYTKQGHTACIRDHFGSFWACFACLFLVAECVGAMISEMSGIAAVGELWGLGRTPATLVAAAIVIGVVFCGSYKQVESIGVVLGLFELTFVITMLWFHPPLQEVAAGSVSFSSDSEFVKLIAANIGAVIMPWMIYFQQSAVVARQLRTKEDLDEERCHTLAGSCLTQLIMIGALVTLAAAHAQSRNIESVRDIAEALSPVLGVPLARLFVTLAFVGGSLCAALVVSLAASWAVCEALGLDHSYSMDEPPNQAPTFYGCFLIIVLIGVGVLLGGVNIVKLNVAVEVMDGLLMPVAVGFLWFLASGPVLPKEARLAGWRKWLLGTIFSICSVTAVVSAVYGLVGGSAPEPAPV